MNPILNLSVVVITLNEEENLPRLLATLPAGVELIVLDSASSDRTREVAAAAGATVQTKSFEGYASQKNAAIDLATRGWIFSIDADEVPSKELWTEILAFVKKNNQNTAARIRRHQIFLGKRLKYGKTEDAPLRLFPRGKGTFDQEIHEELRLPVGTLVTTLPSALDHHSYKSLTDYFVRFNRYTSAVAKNHRRKNTRIPSHLEQGARFFMEFIWRYLLRGGFLDGYAGFMYALFGSVYVFVKYAKLEELSSGLHRESKES